MYKVLASLVLVSCAGIATATAQVNVLPVKKEFLDSTFTVLPSEAGAYYRRETEYTDSVGAVMRDYFLNGKLQSICTYEHLKNNVINGAFENWYPNGQLKWHQEYIHGKQSGETRLYYPDGQLKRRESYVAGKRITGDCYAADGKPKPFFEYMQLPVYSGGDGSTRAIIAAVAEKIQYPKDALRANITGKVLISFNVTEKGTVSNVRVTQGVFPSIDAEAMRAVNKLGPFRPGRADGEVVAVPFTIPITFKIEDSRSLFAPRTRVELPGK